jgi:copper chaperone CopZ
MKKYTLHTPDMSCQHCVMRITKILNEAGYKNFKVILDSKTVEIETDQIEKVLESLNLGGYPSTIVS